ncbi:hypothetical protein RHGRI_000331 [Rhododendron griersonianum]|uniref:Uncharacterized protein n=1 Tax=Rhododendron griersonianum TaxID=479676 RepID=A0AAV6LGJ8_9ERIC|nr:hypothetical protein RHGRI_000331 [Rhododendron griersonianum]
MVVPEPGHFLAPGARITSRIGNTPVFVDVAEIATALDYQRPTRPVNFPRPDETFDQNEIAGYLYEHRKNARIPHWPGRFTTAYRFINQVVCFNLYPRGREGAPQKSVGNLMYAFMGEDTSPPPDLLPTHTLFTALIAAGPGHAGDRLFPATPGPVLLLCFGCTATARGELTTLAISTVHEHLRQNLHRGDRFRGDLLFILGLLPT